MCENSASMTDVMTSRPPAADRSFSLEEATIDELHEAIRAGETTCVDVVQHYIARVRAYQRRRQRAGDGGRRAGAGSDRRGARRGAAALPDRRRSRPPTILPDLDKYQGPPLEFGRMEPTASDPSVQQQFGMIVGIPNAGQVNALATLNIRGERSVTCRGEFDRHPSLGPAAARRAAGVRVLPPAARTRWSAPPSSTRTYGRNPDLDEDADVRRRVLVQGPVRHQGHALDRRRRRALRHRLSGARPRAGRAAAQQGRDHLRQGGEHRIQRPRRRSRRPAPARQGAALDARLSAQHLGRQSRRTPTTRRARPRSARARARRCRSAPTW